MSLTHVNLTGDIETSPRERERAEMAKNPSGRVDVTIVGGGIAGLTAALRLAQSGCKVTVYEEAPTAGGNLGGDKPDGIYHDVYPHMFGDWYNNFWKLADDLGLARGRDFKPMHSCAFLRRGDFPNFKYVADNGSLTSLISNLTSGIMPVPDMFLAGYSTIDLLSQDFSANILGVQTVNGFLASRPYATAGMADIAELVTSNIWGVNSYLTSAFAFQQFLKYQVRHPAPQCWVLKDNSYNSFIEPLINKLHSFDCDIDVNKAVEHVTIARGRVNSIVIKDVINNEHQTITPVDNLILAIPPKRLAELVQAKAQGSNESEDSKHEPIVSVLPQLSQLRRIRSMPIVVLDVAFRRRLPDIPPCYVSLPHSSCELTFVENPQLSFQGETVLSVAASNPYALRHNFEVFPKSEFGYSFSPLVESSEEKGQQEWAYLLLKELHDYIPFKLGDGWGDEQSDVDWDKTASGFRANKQHLLFINEVGSEQWRPKVSYLEKISNLFFAGDFCENPITIATVEAAVVSGLQAANALGRNENIGNVIEIIQPDYYPQSLMAVLKLVLAPYAVGAKCWSASSGSFDTMNWGAGSGEAIRLVSRAASLSADGSTAAALAAMKWWEAMGSLYGWRRR